MSLLLAGFVSSVPVGMSGFITGVSFLMWVTIMKKKSTVKMRSGIEVMFNVGTLRCLCRLMFIKNVLQSSVFNTFSVILCGYIFIIVSFCSSVHFRNSMPYFFLEAALRISLYANTI